jgi:hypothetical protein
LFEEGKEEKKEKKKRRKKKKEKKKEKEKENRDFIKKKDNGYILGGSELLLSRSSGCEFHLSGKKGKRKRKKEEGRRALNSLVIRIRRNCIE